MMEVKMMNRTDVAKLVLEQVRERAAGELAESVAAVVAARQEFLNHMVEMARVAHEGLLREAERVLPGIVGTCRHRDPQDGGSVLVTFLEGDRSYQSDFVFHVQVAVDARGEELRLTWATALAAQKAAEARDTRASALKDDARAELIKNAIENSAAGAELLAVAKRCAAQVEL